MPTNVVDGLAGKVVLNDGIHVIRLSCVAGGPIAAGDAVKYSGADTVIRCAAQSDDVVGYAERRRENGGAALDAFTFANGEAVSVVSLGSACLMMVNAGATVVRGMVAILHTTPHLVDDSAVSPALAVRTAGVFAASRTGAGVVPVNLAGHA